jgi:hypothetical protein
MVGPSGPRPVQQLVSPSCVSSCKAGSDSCASTQSRHVAPTRACITHVPSPRSHACAPSSLAPARACIRRFVGSLHPAVASEDGSAKNTWTSATFAHDTTHPKPSNASDQGRHMQAAAGPLHHHYLSTTTSCTLPLVWCGLEHDVGSLGLV